MSLKGVKINGFPYAIDFNELDNLPSFLSVSNADIGKVLMVNRYGSWSAESIPSGGNGSFDGLPTVTSSDEGKILMVNSSGQWGLIVPEMQQNGSTWTMIGVPNAEEGTF